MPLVCLLLLSLCTWELECHCRVPLLCEFGSLSLGRWCRCRAPLRAWEAGRSWHWRRCCVRLGAWALVPLQGAAFGSMHFHELSGVYAGIISLDLLCFCLFPHLTCQFRLSRPPTSLQPRHRLSIGAASLRACRATCTGFPGPALVQSLEAFQPAIQTRKPTPTRFCLGKDHGCRHCNIETLHLAHKVNLRPFCVHKCKLCQQLSNESLHPIGSTQTKLLNTK